MVKIFYILCASIYFFIVYAVPPSLPAAQHKTWELWLHEQIIQQPAVIGAQKTMEAAFSQTTGMQLPLYNPEIMTEYERNGDDNNYRVGVNQTIDLWDKRGVRSQQADYLRQAARQNYQLVIQQKTAEALRILIEYQAFKELAGFAQEQESQMDKLLGLVVRHQEAGDMSQLDFELAFLSLTQRLNATAQAKVQARQAESRLNELLPEWSPASIEIPKRFWQIKGKQLTSQDLDNLPAVAAARAQYKAATHDARLAKLAVKSEPTLGINGGEDGGDGVVAVNLSFPLNLRNNYRAEAEAVNLQSMAAGTRYYALKRQYHFAGQAALAALQEYHDAFQRWQVLSQGRSAATGLLLVQQWESGDMSTADYLLTLDQRVEGMIAGIELRTQFQRACVDWLLISGQLGAEESSHKINE